MAAISKTPSGNYKGVFTSQPMDSVVDAINNLTGNGTAGAVTANPLTATNVTITGTYKGTPQFVAAAGATQGTATAITSSLVVINLATTNSSKGVKLPTGVTGLEVTIVNAASHGVKVYPFTNNKIGANATNVADATLLKNKTNTYYATSSTFWVAQTGA